MSRAGSPTVRHVLTVAALLVSLVITSLNSHADGSLLANAVAWSILLCSAGLGAQLFTKRENSSHALRLAVAGVLMALSSIGDSVLEEGNQWSKVGLD